MSSLAHLLRDPIFSTTLEVLSVAQFLSTAITGSTFEWCHLCITFEGAISYNYWVAKFLINLEKHSNNSIFITNFERCHHWHNFWWLQPVVKSAWRYLWRFSEGYNYNTTFERCHPYTTIKRYHFKMILSFVQHMSGTILDNFFEWCHPYTTIKGYHFKMILSFVQHMSGTIFDNIWAVL